MAEIHTRGSRRLALYVLLVASALASAGCRTRATPGTIELEEYAVYRAALGAESYAIETRAPESSPCKPAEARAEECSVSAELLSALTSARASSEELAELAAEMRRATAHHEQPH